MIVFFVDVDVTHICIRFSSAWNTHYALRYSRSLCRCAEPCAVDKKSRHVIEWLFF